jgi:hypothetical protein
MAILSDAEQTAVAEATEGGLVEAGTYICRIVGVEKWKTGTSLVWKFRIAPDQPGQGREIYDWTGLTDKGVWKTKERFELLGVAFDADETAFLGMPCQITVEVGTNEQTGTAKNKVTSVEKYAGAIAAEEPQPSDDGIPF